MFTSECVLERRVRSDGDQYLAATDLPLFILKCEDRKADGYAEDKLELYNQKLERMVIGVRLADGPPAVSYLAILGARLFGEIVAVDKTVIVIRLGFSGERDPMSYLIYDAAALSLRMIPQPENHYTLGSGVSIARPRHGGDYALVRMVIQDEDDDSADETDSQDDEDASLFLWRPSSSSLPWSEKGASCFPDVIDWSVNKIDTEFSFNGHAYWVDLMRGVSYCSCDALLDDTTSVVEFSGFINLPVKLRCYNRNSQLVVQPGAYRTMGVVCDSFIRFVSINGFQGHVKKKKRTVTVWRLLGHNEGWEKEHELSMETLWGFDGFGDLPRDWTPMYPLLSTKHTDVVYLVLGEYHKNQNFILPGACYLLAVDMGKKIVTSVPLAWFPEFVSCGFSQHLHKALVGPCDDGGVPVMMEERRRYGGKAPIPMKKPRLEKPILC